MNGQGDIFSEVAHRAGDAARNGMEFVAHAAKAAKEKVGVATRKARTYVAKKIHPQPAGAAIEPCPKNKKAERVAERKARLAASVERLKNMPAGRQRDALAHAIDRFARNNVAVERARLADDVYKVGQGDPPEGWERVGGEDLRLMGMNQEDFPQLDRRFSPESYKDGYFAELYRSKPDVLGQEQYVLSFRGTQGKKDGITDLVQAFGGETDHYSRAIAAARKLKRFLGNKLEVTGHSMGGGMAIAAGLVAGIKVYAIDPAGVHPHTLERVGERYNREVAARYVTNYIADGEILDCIQNPANQRAIVAGATLAAPAIGGTMVVAGRRAMSDSGTVTYGSPGVIHKLPIIANAEDVLNGKSVQGLTPGLAEKLSNAINPIRKVGLHDPIYVIAGLEQQKADDMNTIKRERQ
ncbi:alpha/beta hydrolase family protein [Geomonas oryzae]|uniref:Mbeg1-like protein n=1 Tax=Geomonas oryzae TaxID=2364273 RepID=UPI00100BE20D|nr:Mbeg1-like protein [Geomonas oryzae]